MIEQGIHTEKLRPPPKETIEEDWVVFASATINEKLFGIAADMDHFAPYFDMLGINVFCFY